MSDELWDAVEKLRGDFDCIVGYKSAPCEHCNASHHSSETPLSEEVRIVLDALEEAQEAIDTIWDKSSRADERRRIFDAVAREGVADYRDENGDAWVVMKIPDLRTICGLEEEDE